MSVRHSPTLDGDLLTPEYFEFYVRDFLYDMSSPFGVVIMGIIIFNSQKFIPEPKEESQKTEMKK